MTLRFELFSDGVGHYRFRIIAPNGHVVAVSAVYECKAAGQARNRDGAQRCTGGHTHGLHPELRTVKPRESRCTVAADQTAMVILQAPIPQRSNRNRYDDDD